MPKETNKEKVTNLFDQGRPLTPEEVDQLSEEEMEDIMNQPVKKGEAINLVRNAIGVELDQFQKFIGEPLRIMAIQNLALIELLKDKDLLVDDEEFRKYLERADANLKELEEADDAASEETEEQQGER